MENNQMNQFFTEQPNEPQPQQPQFGQQAEQPQFAQPQQQAEQQPQQSPFTQPQPQQTQQPFFGQQAQSVFNMNAIEMTPEMSKKVSMASNIAMAGGALVVVATLVRIIINFLTLGEVGKIVSTVPYIPHFREAQSQAQTNLIFGFIILIVASAFIALAFLMRKASRKTIAINLIVFSSIFILLLLIGVIYSMSHISELNSVISKFDHMILSAQDKTLVSSMRNISGQATMLVFVGVVSTIGWIGVLVGGILRVNIKDNKPVVKW